MCLSKAFGLLEDGSEKLLVDYVSGVKIKEDEVELRDLMGGIHSFKGKLAEIDLENNKLHIVLD